MKRICTIFLCCYSIYAQAQNPSERQTPNTSFGKKNGNQSVVLNIGAGFESPGQTLKDNANLQNSTRFNLNAFVPIWSFGGATGGVINLGINAGGEYFQGNSDYKLNAITPYQINGQSTPPVVTAKGAGSPKQPGFKTEAGVQANFSFGKIVVSPILNAGYFSLNQKAFTVTQTSMVNGRTYESNLYNQAASKTTGFAILPKLRVGYFPGRLGIFAEGNYVSGPKVTTEATRYTIDAAANPKNGTYSIDQVITATPRTQTRSNTYNSFGATVGISFYVSKRGYEYYKAQSDMGSAGKGQHPNLSKKGYDYYKAHSEMVSVGTGNNPAQEDSSVNQNAAAARRRVEVLKSNKTGDPNAKNLTASDPTPPKPPKLSYSKTVENPLYEGSGSSESNPMQDAAAKSGGRTYTGGRKNEAAQAAQIETNPLYTGGGHAQNNPLYQGFTAGTPIGGIVVKGGKNPGGNMLNLVSDQKGIFEFTVSEPGDYKLTLTASPELETKARKVARKAAKKARAARAVVQNPLYNEPVSTGNNPLYQGFTAGSPIGGIVVKGGKNPGGNLRTMTSPNGDIILTNLEPGAYKFTITVPTQEKSISEKGVSSTKPR